MRPYNRQEEKQVRLTVFDNEPMARLAEQRLRQMGIPCLIRSLRGGPGLWGSAYNLPHDLYVFLSDEDAARDVLELVPPEPGEERDQKVSSTPHLAPVSTNSTTSAYGAANIISRLHAPETTLVILEGGRAPCPPKGKPSAIIRNLPSKF